MPKTVVVRVPLPSWDESEELGFQLYREDGIPLTKPCKTEDGLNWKSNRLDYDQNLLRWTWFCHEKWDKTANPFPLRAYDSIVSATFRKTRARFGGLSNMAGGFPLRVNGIDIRTSEALYQALKYPHNSEAQQAIISQNSPMIAKRVAWNYKDFRSDWDHTKVLIMEWCLRVKLHCNFDSFSGVLQETNSMPIVESSARDNFWGAIPQRKDEHCVLIGRNVLGTLLDGLRKNLKEFGRDFASVVEPLDIPNFRLMSCEIGTLHW